MIILSYIVNPLFPLMILTLTVRSFFFRPFCGLLFLLAYPGNLFLRRRYMTFQVLLHLISEDTPGKKSVHGLGPGLLTLHLEPGGNVFELHTAGRFVDLLPSSPLCPYKLLFDITLIYTQLLHPVFKHLFFLRRDEWIGHLQRLSFIMNVFLLRGISTLVRKYPSQRI